MIEETEIEETEENESPPPPPSRMIYLLQRVAECAVAFVAFAVSALTWWLIYRWAFVEPRGSTDPFTMMAVMYAIGFLAAALILFGLRLTFPRLRIEKGNVVGRRGIAAFTLIYSLLVVLTIFQGAPEYRIQAIAVLGVALAVLLLRLMFRSKGP